MYRILNGHNMTSPVYGTLRFLTDAVDMDLVGDYCFMSLYAQSWEYCDRKKPKRDYALLFQMR